MWLLWLSPRLGFKSPLVWDFFFIQLLKFGLSYNRSDRLVAFLRVPSEIVYMI